MSNRVHLTPAYGRDYRSKQQVREALFANNDFIIADVVSPWCGKPASLDSLKEAGVTVAVIRYSKKTKVTAINIQR